MMSNENGSENERERQNSEDWTPEPAELRDSESVDTDAHARRNLEQLRIAKEELELDDPEGSTDKEVRDAIERLEQELETESEPEHELIADGGEDIPEVVIPTGEGSKAEKYHAKLSPCSFHLKASRVAPVNFAQARGLSACSSCNPPTFCGFDEVNSEPEPMTDGGVDVGMRIDQSTARLYRDVIQAIARTSLSDEHVDIDPGFHSVRVSYSTDLWGAIDDALDRAGLTCSTWMEARAGPGADSVRGVIHVTRGGGE